MTRKQRRREEFAALHESISKKSEFAKRYRRQNRQIEMKKGKAKK